MVIILIIIAIFLSLASASAPPIIYMGGIFNPVTTPERHHLAAFLMAVKEINNKTDGLWDDILPETTIKFAIRSAAGYRSAAISALQLSQTFNGTGVSSIVTSLPGLETISINKVTIELKTPVVRSFAYDGILGSATEFPYSSATVAVETFEAMVWQSVLCSYFNVKKVALVVIDDYLGIRYHQELIDGTFCEIEVLAVVSLGSATSLDMSSQIQKLKASGAKYFGLFVSPLQAARLMEQGSNDGLFTQDTLVFSTESVSSSIASLLTPGSDVPKILRGFMGLSRYMNYVFGRLPDSIAFAHRWKRQPSTMTPSGYCDASYDDDHSYALYRSPADPSVCNGLDFSTFDELGLKMCPYSPSTYDAVILLARAYDLAIRHGLPLTGDSLQSLILSNISFTGVSGFVDIFPGMQTFDMYGKGDREVDVFYQLLNFNAASYASNRNKAFKPFSIFSPRLGVLKCDSLLACQEPVYRDESSIPPLDAVPPINISQFSFGERVLLRVVVALLSVVILFFSAVTIRYRSSKIIQVSQPCMLTFMLIGAVGGLTRIAITLLPLSDSTCIVKVATGHFSFFLIFIPLSVKTWRVSMLINTTSFLRVKFSSMHSTLVVLGTTSLMSLFLVIVVFVGQPYLNKRSTTINNQTTNEFLCMSHHPYMEMILFFIDFVVLLVGFWYCWLVKDAPDLVNEVKYIAVAATAIVITSLVLFPVTFLVKISAVQQELLVCLGIGLATAVTICAIFGPKAYTLILGSGSAPAPKLRSIVKVFPGDLIPVPDPVVVLPSNSDGENLQELFRRRVVVKLANKDRTDFINQNISYWKKQLEAELSQESKRPNLSQSRGRLDNSRDYGLQSIMEDEKEDIEEGSGQGFEVQPIESVSMSNS